MEKFKFIKENTVLLLDDGVDVNKFGANIKAVEANRVKDLFIKHGYSVDDSKEEVIPGHFIKSFNIDLKEFNELENVLEEIDELGLKDIFNSNLRVQVFKRIFLERVKYCLERGIPFLNSDNSFVSNLNNADDYGEYIVSAPIESINKEVNLDAEDMQVKNEIIATLGQISSEDSNVTVTEVISNIIANLDNVIKNDNKNYHFMGYRHLIENALAGVQIDPLMQSVLDTQILPAFPDRNIGRSNVA